MHETERIHVTDHLNAADQAIWQERLRRLGFDEAEVGRIIVLTLRHDRHDLESLGDWAVWTAEERPWTS